MWLISMMLLQRPADSGSGGGGRPNEPPGWDEEGVARLSTPAGEAAIEVLLDCDSIPPDGQLLFRLVNRGRVELLTGPRFEVEYWDDGQWVTIPPSSVGGFTSATIARGQLRRTGESTMPQAWPPPGITTEPGWYRIVKSARLESVHGGQDQKQLTARARFRVSGGQEPA